MSIRVRKLDFNEYSKNPNVLVKVETAGNIISVQYMSKRNNKQIVRMLPGGTEYLNCITGEISPITKHNSRIEQFKSLRRTFNTVRSIINANVTDVSCCKWITLTYAENMIDTTQLYNDFRKFNMRFQAYCKKNCFGKPEYITMVEPQGRGAWHHHLLYIFPDKAPYIPNDYGTVKLRGLPEDTITLSDLWGHGWTKTKKLDNVDNIGAYLTAYLGDMEFDRCCELGLSGTKCKILDVDGEKKCFIKGARLFLYPVNFNMYRCSRGIKRPSVEMLTQKKAMEKVSSAKLTYSKSFELFDDETEFECVVETLFYNKNRK